VGTPPSPAAPRGPITDALIPRLLVSWDAPDGQVVRLLVADPVDAGGLAACPAVASVVRPTQRAADALHRRSWSWPTRVGVADDDLRAALVGGALLDMSDVRSEPGAVDVLVLRATPADAAAFATANRPVANAVVCIEETEGDPTAREAALAALRLATAAVLTAVIPETPAPSDVAAQLSAVVAGLARGRPIDVALTAAFGRGIRIEAEPAALDEAELPVVLGARARQARHDLRVFARAARPSPEAGAIVPPPVVAPPMPVPPPPVGVEPPAAVEPPLGADLAEPPVGAEPPAADAFDPAAAVAMADRLDDLAVFAAEPAEPALVDSRAVGAARVRRRLDAQIAAAAADVPRLLQAYVRDPETPVDAVPAAGFANVLRPGPNAVDVFVGPEEVAALHGRETPDEAMGFGDPAVASARLTVVLAPLVPIGEAVQAELVVPRVGRSATARLTWTIPDHGVVQARLVLLHRNRVIQTARLTGKAGGTAELADRIILWEKTARLDDRRPFDRTFVLNPAVTGQSRLVSHANGSTVIRSMDEIDAIADRIRDQLARATQLTARGKAAQEETRRILVQVAVHGHDLHDLLADYLTRFDEAQRIQIVSARSARFLPLELVYGRPAPQDDAVLCANWVAGKECGDGCFRGPDDIGVVCPAVFWGMSRVIERQRASLADEDGDAFVVSVTPTRRRRRLQVRTALLAASSKVRPVDVGRTAAALGDAPTAAGWDKWVSALEATPTDLLVLMPHTDPKAGTLEISGSTLPTARIEQTYVAGGQKVTPVMVLFGCDTAGSKDDPAGYATRFLMKGAAVVFSTLTMLLGRHAAAMSQQLAATLRAPDRAGAPLGAVVAAFRRDAGRAGPTSARGGAADSDGHWTE